jgi:DNA-directed RNA polymerase sigma subunit (sigma70/sigma32)
MSFAWSFEEPASDAVDIGAAIDEDLLALQTDRHLFDELTDLEREVIVKRFGLDGRSPHRLLDLETELHIRRNELREMEVSALRKLRSHLT